MHSIIVVPPASAPAPERITLTSGDRLPFGRAETKGALTIAHPGVPGVAGEITANGSYWLLSNLSEDQTYVVENREDASEHIKVPPGRVEAPVSFELARVVLFASGDLLRFEVWAPGHAFHGPEAEFHLDRTRRYFAVLVALCEPRLRDGPHAPLPPVEDLVKRLRPTWPTVTRSAVHWNIDYLAFKLRQPSDPESLVDLALRNGLASKVDLLGLNGWGFEH
ncbi:FHA domain-containing protein [Streptomyces sp. B93]|uniref:FHA domain-containing protein n=1 Tax=Streptomyces sp. B93 TaxID=2824875 RepID=UPI001B36462E|nr:FHA domain-containing protein [Streptomyces sp. B93]MBQ1090192.1 FHA domain-containing protein [Streptomyces sp. B93]